MDKGIVVDQALKEMSSMSFTEEEDERFIGDFLSIFGPIVLNELRECFTTFDIKFREEGRGLNTVFYLKSKSVEGEFRTWNMFMEMATIDRDERPLRFDTRLIAEDFRARRVANVFESKMQVLIPVILGGDVEVVVESLPKGEYERITFTKFDIDKMKPKRLSFRTKGKPDKEENNAGYTSGQSE